MPLIPAYIRQQKRGEAAGPSPPCQNSSDSRPGTVWTTRSMSVIGIIP